MKKVNIFCYSFQKVKPIHHIDSLHIEWNISSLYFLTFGWLCLTDNENVSGYVCNHGSPSGERDTASPRGRYGERPQRDSVWRYIWKNTTCWPATAHDVTTGVPQYKCRREDTSSAFSSSLTGLFEACRVNLVRVQFSNSTMASTSKAFRKCVDPCPRYLTPDDTHDCCVFCLGMEHARDVLEGAVCVHCERLSVRKLENTTCWPATAHDVTTGVPQYKCRREDTSSASSSEACVRSMAQSPGDAVSRSPLGEPWLHT